MKVPPGIVSDGKLGKRYRYKAGKIKKQQMANIRFYRFSYVLGREFIRACS